MTKPKSESDEGLVAEPERDPAAVRSDADTATDQDDAKTGTTEPVTGETSVISDAEDVEDSEGAPSADSENDKDPQDAEPAKARRRINWSRVLSHRVLPGLALLLALAAGYLKWQNESSHNSGKARIESVAAAKDATIALLSYTPDTVDKDLAAASDRLTGAFKDSYAQLTHDVVIPGAKQKHISSVAKVPAAASVSVSWSHAVALLYVDQTTIVGADAPTDTVSTVRVSMDKVGDRWLVSEFDPI